jgi:hypothetical protein
MLEAHDMTITGPVQRAARLHLGAADLEVRERCRHAPEWVKRRIDAARRDRGSPSLWGGTTSTRQRVAAKVRRLRVFLTLTRAIADA